MRIDKQLSERFGSRTKAARAVEEGNVLVNGSTVSSSYSLKDGDIVTYVEPEISFVSRGGYKLEKGLRDFSMNVSGKIYADIGASAGGFTDCLFRHGAKKVYCVDIGKNQLDASLLSRNVVVIDGFNARNLTPELFDDRLDGIVVDVSFISLTYVMEGIARSLPENGDAVVLVKPQFELDRSSVGKNGIVKDPANRRAAVRRVYDSALACGLAPVSLTEAPVVTGKNVEYLMRLIKKGVPSKPEILIKNVNL